MIQRFEEFDQIQITFNFDDLGAHGIKFVVSLTSDNTSRYTPLRLTNTSGLTTAYKGFAPSGLFYYLISFQRTLLYLPFKAHTTAHT